MLNFKLQLGISFCRLKLVIKIIFYWLPFVFGDSVKIGVIFPLTGSSAADVGIPGQKAVLTGFEIMKKQFPRLSSVKLIFEDAGDSPKQALSAINKLINVDKVDVVLSMTTVVASTITGQINRNQKLHVCYLCWSKEIKTEEDYNFSFDTDGSLAASFIVDYLKSKGAQSIGILAMNNAFGVTMRSNLEKEFGATSDFFKLILSENYNLDEQNFKTLGLKVKNSSIDYLILAEYRLDYLGRIFDGLTRVNHRKPVITITVDKVQHETTKLSFPLLNLTYNFNPHGHLVREFVRTHERLYGQGPEFDKYPYLGFQIFLIIAEVLEACNYQNSQDCYRQRLVRHTFDTIFGPMNFTIGGAPVPPIPLTFDNYTKN
ncbi:MAG: ABC transporter substrate-binding protein [Deltaproteobacteria bacterium]|nr:ABC transporter substrate-binding protein [Deltaproteobacteria bacterium]